MVRYENENAITSHKKIIGEITQVHQFTEPCLRKRVIKCEARLKTENCRIEPGKVPIEVLKENIV
jgi:hypothetical protein